VARRGLAAIALLLAGAMVGLAAVWVHGRGWGLALAAAATLAAELTVPRGAPRVAYAAGWVVSSAYFVLARPEGDFVVGSDPVGYAFLVLGLVVLGVGVVTLAPRRHEHAPTAAPERRRWDHRIGSRP
jgi:hypothetical protein